MHISYLCRKGEQNKYNVFLSMAYHPKEELGISTILKL